MFDKPHEVRKEIIKAVNKSFEIFIFGFLRLTKIIKLNCEIIHYFLFFILTNNRIYFSNNIVFQIIIPAHTEILRECFVPY